MVLEVDEMVMHFMEGKGFWGAFFLENSIVNGRFIVGAAIRR